MNRKIMVCEFHQETDTFNPQLCELRNFAAMRYAEGQEFYDICKKLPCSVHGMIDAIEEAGDTVIPAISLNAQSRGRVSDEVFGLMKERMAYYLSENKDIDAVFCSLHGATCTESEDDACGALLEYLRGIVGNEMIIAASFDLHANATEKILENADVVCGYQSYPHVDFYETGYRAASIGIKKLDGKPVYLAAVRIPVLTPPAGYTNTTEPFKSVIDKGKDFIADGTLYDFTMFNVQPWLDIPCIASTSVAIADSAETACKCADEIANLFFDAKDGCWPKLYSVDEIIDAAEANTSGKPVLMVDSADSPNGGAVGDSILPVMRLLERGSSLKCGIFVKDPEAAEKAFEVGVGGEAEFTVGGKFTPDMPGPLVAKGRVRSLHDGICVQEGPAGKGFVHDMGKTATVSFGNCDVVITCDPGGSGDPQILRHFGVEPKLCDLVVVKANTSFKVPYSAISDLIYNADTPGAGAANLKLFNWKKLPKGIYPLDLPEDYRPVAAKLFR